MYFSFTSDVIRDIKKIKLKQPQLFNKIQKQLKLFKHNTYHPSLRTHKLKGNLSNTWSISIEGNIHMIYFISKNEAVFFKIGNYDTVYKK